MLDDSALPHARQLVQEAVETLPRVIAVTGAQTEIGLPKAYLDELEAMPPTVGKFLAIRRGGSLLIGMIGYHFLEELGWLDSFLNASMILGGMVPVNNPQTGGGKLFAGLYALYSGLVFLVVVGVLFAPVLHRARHLFHWGKDIDK